MRHALDLAGKRFGRLVVQRQAQKVRKHARRIEWECVCDCGAAKIVVGSHLKAGLVKSCGCLRRDRAGGYERTAEQRAKLAAAAKRQWARRRLDAEDRGEAPIVVDERPAPTWQSTTAALNDLTQSWPTVAPAHGGAR